MDILPDRGHEITVPWVENVRTPGRRIPGRRPARDTSPRRTRVPAARRGAARRRGGHGGVGVSAGPETTTKLSTPAGAAARPTPRAGLPGPFRRGGPASPRRRSGGDDCANQVAPPGRRSRRRDVRIGPQAATSVTSADAIANASTPKGRRIWRLGGPDLSPGAGGRAKPAPGPGSGTVRRPGRRRRMVERSVQDVEVRRGHRDPPREGAGRDGPDRLRRGERPDVDAPGSTVSSSSGSGSSVRIGHPHRRQPGTEGEAEKVTARVMTAILSCPRSER